MFKKNKIEMSEFKNFSNFGCLFDTVPDDLFKKIQEESDDLEKSNSKMISGLTGSGVAQHFYMNDTHRKDLIEYVLNLKNIYLSVYTDYLNTFRSFSDSVPFVCDAPWYNLQQKHQFVPNHTHDGFLSYTIWVKIPYDLSAEMIEGGSHVSCFEFTYVGSTGYVLSEIIPVDKSYEGKIMMFPSALTHCVYPFYKSNNARISVSGNILFDTSRSKI
jgi:hypothetical protein